MYRLADLDVTDASQCTYGSAAVGQRAEEIHNKSVRRGRRRAGAPAGAGVPVGGVGGAVAGAAATDGGEEGGSGEAAASERTGGHTCRATRTSTLYIKTSRWELAS